MNKTYQFANRLFHLISEILFSWIKNLSPYATAVLPGFFFGWTIGQFVLQLTESSVAGIFVGSSAFIVLESAGIWSGHKIAEYLGKRDWKIIIPITTFLIYLTVGISTLWFLDGETVNREVQIIGSAMFILAGVIYILFGLQAYQESVELAEKRAVAQEEREKRESIQQKKQEEDDEEEKERQRQIEDKLREQEMRERSEDREHARKMEVKRINAENKRKLIEVTNETAVPVVSTPAPVPMIEQVITTDKKIPRVNQEKMAKLRVLLKSQPNLAKNKSKLARNVGVSRPTLNRYLEILGEEDYV